MKKILVIGESNSVRTGGWVSGLADGLGDEFIVENHSIGSTGLLNAVFQIASKRVDLSEYDAVLLDNLINDTLFFVNACADFARYFTDILSHIRSYGLPVIVMNCERRDMPTNHPNSLKPIAKRICKEQKATFFDTRARLEKKANLEGVSLANLYSDMSHPHLRVARELGLEVAGIVRELPPKNAVERPKAFDFAIIDQKCQKPDKRCRYKNSLIDMPGFIIDSAGINIQIPRDLHGATLIGIMYNVANTTGCLEIVADSRCVKRLTDSRRSTGKLMIWGRLLHTKLRLTSRLGLRALKSDNDIEGTEFCLDDSVVDPGGPICNVAALLLHLPRTAQTSPRDRTI